MNSEYPILKRGLQLKRPTCSLDSNNQKRKYENFPIDKPSNLSSYKTTKFERFLLFILVGSLPLQSAIPKVAGFTLPFLVLIFCGIYIVMNKSWVILKTIKHPVFLSIFAFLILGSFMEVVNGSSGYPELMRILFMVIGAIIIASLCRDRNTLLAGLYGSVFASLWLSGFLILTTYGTLSSVKAENFREASRARYAVFEDSALQENENQIAWFAAQGGVVAFGLILTEKIFWRQLIVSGIGLVILVGTFLPMSRGGIMVLVLGCSAILYKQGIFKPKVIMAVLLLGSVTFLLVPDTVFKRFTLASIEDDPNRELHGRERIYSAAIEHFPEYIVSGVGITNFYGSWGMRSSFFDVERLGVTGGHNCFIQVALYWGIPGLLALCFVIWQAYRCFPGKYFGDSTRLCVLGLCTGILFETIVRHQLYAKDFAIALGILVGASMWVWKKPMIQRRMSYRKVSHRNFLPIGSPSVST